MNIRKCVCAHKEKRGNDISVWYGACDLWNFVDKMVLRKKTSGMRRPGNQHTDTEVSRAKPRLHHKQMPRTSWPRVPRSTSFYPSPLKHVQKSCHVELCSSEADKMTRHQSPEQMTHSFAYIVGNPSILYCKQIVIWRLYLRDQL